MRTLKILLHGHGWPHPRTGRKFKVIFALDLLTDKIIACGGDLLKITPKLLKVAGDNADMPYDGESYREAAKAQAGLRSIRSSRTAIGLEGGQMPPKPSHLSGFTTALHWHRSPATTALIFPILVSTV